MAVISLYGTCSTPGAPIFWQKIEPAIWLDVPTPEELKLHFAGSLRMWATSSSAVLMPRPAWATSTSGSLAVRDTAAKSWSGSKGRLRYTYGLMQNGVAVEYSRVAPSGRETATWRVPMLPAAPGLFSTMKFPPRRLATSSTSRRAITSVLPPEPYGTMTVTGPAG